MEPSEDAIKELYARFGLAYYASECLHRELCHLYALSPFSSPDGLTRPRIEERLGEAYSLTLGDVVGRLETLVDPDLYKRLDYANGKRKFLAHHFWFDKIHLSFSEDGIEALVTDLNTDTELFRQLDEEVGHLTKKKLTMLGITEEVCAQALKEIQSGSGADLPLMKRRKISKTERIVRAWEIPTTEKNCILVLEAADGELLQFCEAGLGWSPFTTPGANWQVAKSIQRHLPATINPRPQAAQPWCFDFQLQNKHTLWIRPGKDGGKRRWGISATPPN